MADKVQTNFKLHLKTFRDLDALVESPPEWLESCAPGPVQNRTDVVERLVFLAVKHRYFGAPLPSSYGDESPSPGVKERSAKSKASAKR